MNQTYRVFTDGSAIGNPGPGGWGAVVMNGTRRREMSGGYPRTTISEMELVAAIEALRTLPFGARVDLHSDSQYLIYGMNCFISKWERDGWRNHRGSPIQHRKLTPDSIPSLPIADRLSMLVDCGPSEKLIDSWTNFYDYKRPRPAYTVLSCGDSSAILLYARPEL